MKHQVGRPLLSPSGKTKIVSVTLPPNIIDDAKEAAKDLNSNFSAYVRQALVHYLRGK